MSYDIIPSVVTSDEVIALAPSLTEERLREVGINFLYIKNELLCYGIEDFNALTLLAQSDQNLKDLLILYTSLKAKIEDAYLTNDSLTYVNDGYVTSKTDPDRIDKYVSALISKVHKVVILIKKAAQIPLTSVKRDGIGIGVSKPVSRAGGCIVENTLN